MNLKNFTAVVKGQFRLCESILCAKGVEYATTADRLANFKKAAPMVGKTNKQILGGYMLKHTVSIYEMIENDTQASIEMWEEKISDHINYLLLLKALVIEESRCEE